MPAPTPLPVPAVALAIAAQAGIEDARGDLRIDGHIWADRNDFVALNYYNPPGDVKTCLNSKVASCDITLTEKSRIGLKVDLKTKNRAAFEVLTSKTDHGFSTLF